MNIANEYLAKKLLFGSLLVFSGRIFAMEMESGMHDDDPLLTMFQLDQFEHMKSDEESGLVVEGGAWIGYDLDKLWLKTEVERSDSETEELELQLLYSRAVTAFWDFQLGIRSDLKPAPDRNWAVIGFQGIAPYFLETDAALFVGESGQTAFRLSSEYEILITQKLILSPEFEVNFYGKDDPDLGIGSGLSDAEIGLRLRYELRREFAPYIGVEWEKVFSGTADFTEAAGEDVSETKIVMGVKIWF